MTMESIAEVIGLNIMLIDLFYLRIDGILALMERRTCGVILHSNICIHVTSLRHPLYLR